MQIPAAVAMVRPASFGFNPDTAPSFLFQREITDANRKEIERRARIEFDLLAGRLRDAGAEVIIFEDKEELQTPDAVFPITGFRSITTARSCCIRCLRPAAGPSGAAISSRNFKPE